MSSLLNKSPIVYNTILHLIPCKKKEIYDPVKLVEDIYSLNIVGMPNFERKAREIIEEFLPSYVTNPKVVRLLGADRSDLESLCNILTTMRPYVANLAHEILRNSNEGVQLQLIGSFSNLQTINRMINEDPDREETIFSLGKQKDAEAIETLKKRLKNSELPILGGHLLETVLSEQPCTFRGAQWLRESTWGFPITGITSPVPCEQVKIQDFDTTVAAQKNDCTIVKTSYKLKTEGKLALRIRGPFEPYLGSSTPEKMIKPKLTVVNPNPQVKSVMKLFYILPYLERMDPTSDLIGLVMKMIENKLQYLPDEFRNVPLSDWCGRNYGGSYEHRLKASSQKRSALFSLTENLATHVTINTNLLGKSLRGNEDYNLFFQEIFLFIQNFITEKAMRNQQIFDTYAVPLNCLDCTYLILNTPISVNLPHMGYQSKMIQEHCKSNLSKTNLTESVQTCILGMSLSIGRKLTTSRLHDPNIHNTLESFKGVKTDESTDRTSSNLMSEFRSPNLDYVIVGAMQGSKQLTDLILGKTREYPVSLFDHLAYLIINSDRIQELLMKLEVPIEKHSSITQTSGLAKVLSYSTIKYVRNNLDSFLRASTFATFISDVISKQAYFWRTFIGEIVKKDTRLNSYQKRGILRAPQCGGVSVHEWKKDIQIDLTKGMAINLRYDEGDAISVWRDLKNELNEHLVSRFPLSTRLERTKSHIQQIPELRVEGIISDCFHFSFESLLEHGVKESPIWVKWIHHCTRPIGRISTSASKIHQLLGYYDEVFDKEGSIVTLAEGSGGILHYLSHIFPESLLIYNTLQSDIVENKENILNILPPSLVGDKCQPSERLVGLEETCLGETDITTDIFLEKLSRLLKSLRSKVLIFSMDAELKADLTNTDKLKLYLPLLGEYFSEHSLFINKMFIKNQEEIDWVRDMCEDLGYNCNFHKPSSSHAHNDEIYVVCFKKDNSFFDVFMEVQGEQHSFSWKAQYGKIQLLSTRNNRVNFLKTILGHAENSLFTNVRGHPCVWSVREKYQLDEITRFFTHKRHQRNLIMYLLAIERNTEVIDLVEKNVIYVPFLKKEQIVALLVLSILTNLSKNHNQLVSILDSLSILEVKCNIVPPRKIEISLFLITGPEVTQRSVLGVLDHKMKDYFRTLSYFKKETPGNIPSYSLQDGITKIKEAEGIRFEIENNLKELVRESECGYSSFLEILRRS